MKYDVAVVGAGLGGLAAAALLAKKGKRVVLLERHEQVGGAVAVFDTRGFHFSTSPTLTFGFERGGALENLYAELGIAHSTSTLSPCYQVALPDRRISVYADKTETLDELRREFPDEITVIERLYRDIRKRATQTAKSRIAAFFADHRQAGSFLKKYRLSSELTTFLDLQSLFFFHRPIQDIRVSSLILLIDNAPVSIHGGLKRVADQMLDAFLKSGGEIRYKTPWPELALTQNRVSGLVTSDGLIEAGAVLFNTQQDHKGPILFVGLRDEAVPVGMSHELVSLPDYAEPNNVFTISLSSRDDSSFAPREARALTASFPFWESKPGLQDVLLNQIERVLMPFLTDNLVVVDEHRPEPRSYAFPPQIQFKTIRTEGDRSLLDKAASQNVSLIHDGVGSLVQSIHAARRFVRQFS